MPIDLPRNSRFKKTQIVSKDGHLSFGRWGSYSFLDRSKLLEREITTVKIDQRNAGRPDLIALEQYGDQRLYWVVIMFNRPQNPLGWPKAGTTIEIPTRSAVDRDI